MRKNRNPKKMSATDRKTTCKMQSGRPDGDAQMCSVRRKPTCYRSVAIRKCHPHWRFTGASQKVQPRLPNRRNHRKNEHEKTEIYRPRSLSTLTRSASEGVKPFPRWRFGLVCKCPIKGYPKMSYPLAIHRGFPKGPAPATRSGTLRGPSGPFDKRGTTKETKDPARPSPATNRNGKKIKGQKNRRLQECGQTPEDSFFCPRFFCLYSCHN